MLHGPSGFTRSEIGGTTLVLRDDVAPALVAAAIDDPESLRRRALAVYEGRGAPFGVDVEGVGRVFVRPYLHGGLLGRITREYHAGDGRFLDELLVLAAARTAGVPVPEPLGIVSRPRALGLRQGWLIVREVPGAVDLMVFLAGAPSAPRRREVLAAAGRVLRDLHDAGFEHPDLHLKNLLLAPSDPGERREPREPRASGNEPRVLVLDLDRVRRLPSLSRERRLAGLFRFDRYAEKQASRGFPVSRVDRMRVLRAYAGGDWPRRDELRALAARLARHVARHAAPHRVREEPAS